MKNSIDASTGEVKIANADYNLVSNAIGSCVVVSMYDPLNKLGGLAHIMLPGKAPNSEDSKATKYAENAIESLIELMQLNSDDYQRLKICLVGGGNVLKKADDTICDNNIKSVKEIIKNRNMTVSAESIGGTKRRTIRFDVEMGDVYITEDGSQEILLRKSNGDI